VVAPAIHCTAPLGLSLATKSFLDLELEVRVLVGLPSMEKVLL